MDDWESLRRGAMREHCTVTRFDGFPFMFGFLLWRMCVLARTQLTPWFPIIASRSHIDTKFFLLPWYVNQKTMAYMRVRVSMYAYECLCTWMYVYVFVCC